MCRTSFVYLEDKCLHQILIKFKDYPQEKKHRFEEIFSEVLLQKMVNLWRRNDPRLPE